MIDELNESQLLDHIRKLAVQGKNTEVHRQEFYNLHQEPGMPRPTIHCATMYQSGTLYFSMLHSPGCSSCVNYAPSMISDQLTIGLYDKDIQGEALAKGNQLKSFDEKLNLVIALADGKRAPEQLDSDVLQLPLSTQHTINSTTKGRFRHQILRHPMPLQSQLHVWDVEAGTMAKEQPSRLHCPARNMKCENCDIVGHTQIVCRKEEPSINSSMTGVPWFMSTEAWMSLPVPHWRRINRPGY